MVAYEIMLKDRTVEIVEEADAYQQEGQMTTFFSTGEGRRVVDCWSTRLASFRTSEILIVRRVDRGTAAATTAGTDGGTDDETDAAPNAMMPGPAAMLRLRSA